MEVAPLSRHITQEAVNRYAEASGDFNPIHVDADYAATTPLGGTVVHGMLTLALVSEMMTAAFGRAWLATGRLDVRFRAPARPGETLTARALQASAEGGWLRFNVECLNQAGEVLISGTTRVQWP